MILTFNFEICYVNSFHLVDRELNLGSKGLIPHVLSITDPIYFSGILDSFDNIFYSVSQLTVAKHP